MNLNAARITELLHQVRTTATADQLHELSAAIRASTTEEVALALLGYVSGMFESVRAALLVELNAARTEAEREERETQPGSLH